MPIKTIFPASSGNFALLEIFTADAEGERRIGVDVNWWEKPTDADVQECDKWFEEVCGGFDEFVSKRDESTTRARQRIAAFVTTGNPDSFGGDGCAS